MVLSKSRNNPSGDGQGEGHEGQVSRPSIYMSREIEIELEAQADIDRTSKSRVITDVFELLLLTPIGQSLAGGLATLAFAAGVYAGADSGPAAYDPAKETGTPVSP